MGTVREKTVILENGQVISYILDCKSRKNMYICIREGRVVLKIPPEFSVAQGEEFLRQKTDWIIKNLDCSRCVKRGFTSYKDGDGIYLAGTLYRISLIYSERYFKPCFEDGALKISVNKNYTEGYVIAQAESAVQEKAVKIITDRVNFLTSLTGLFPESVTVKQLKSSWGRCSSERRISINLDVVYFDMECIDYVIIHELCHLVYMDHSGDFWRLVEKYCPEWKRIRRSMRE